jgi:hypothetical protein
MGEMMMSTIALIALDLLLIVITALIIIILIYKRSKDATNKKQIKRTLYELKILKDGWYESAGKYEDLEMLYKVLGKFSFNSQCKVEYVIIKIDETVLEKQ